MTKKTNHLQKQLKFHCWKCQTVYQLSEIHSQTSSDCSDNCRKKWQELCHEYYNEKVLGYVAQQEEAKEKELEEKQENYDWLKKSTK